MNKLILIQRCRCAVCAVEFDPVALQPTYRLMWGAVGQSNALDIAGGLGLPAGMLAAARLVMRDELSDTTKDKRSGALMVSKQGPKENERRT
jgi:dsDNA-specific endonuclease/ATPase MutS2